MSKTDYIGKEPEILYVVVSEGKHRIYEREAQAANWFSKKIAEGKYVQLWSYTKDQMLGG